MNRLNLTATLVATTIICGCGKMEYNRRMGESVNRLGTAGPAEEAPTTPEEAFASLIDKNCRFFNPSTGVSTMSVEATKSATPVTEYDEDASYDLVLDSIGDEVASFLPVIRAQLNGIKLTGDVGDGIASAVTGLRGITWLVLEDTKVTDSGLRNLGDLATVENLSMLNNSDLTNQTIEYVLAMESIRQITLSGGFTDEGVTELSNYPNIDRITLHGGGGITQAAVDFLRREMPDSTITLE